MKNRITRRRTKKEVEQDNERDRLFNRGFGLALALLCENTDENQMMQGFVESRCRTVLDEAGYRWEDFMVLPFDDVDLEILKNLFNKKETPNAII